MNFPKQIESTKAAIEGYTADVSRLEANTVKVAEGISPMIIDGNNFTERKDAGAALIEACRGIHGAGTDKVGAYRGFEMSVSFDFSNKEYKCHLKGAMTHTVPLGSDPAGNITRIDNALEKITATLAATEAKLETLYSQVENAKTELTKPFPQEAVLTEKSARLTELDTLLSLDGKDEPDDNTRADSEIDNKDGAPEKELAVKESNAQLSGDESTPQVQESHQPQYPRPAQQTPQTVTPVLKDGSVAVREENNAEQSPQITVKKKSYDAR